MTDEKKPKTDGEREPEKRREISREEACKRIGCSVFQCVLWEKAGKIRVRRDDGGADSVMRKRMRVWLDAEDVGNVAKTWIPRRQTVREKIDTNLVACNARGKLAAMCFPIFDELCTGQFDDRKAFSEVARRTEGDPDIILTLYEKWKLGLNGNLADKKKRENEARERELQRDHDKKSQYNEYRQFKREETRDLKEVARLKLEAEKLAAMGRKTG